MAWTVASPKCPVPTLTFYGDYCRNVTGQFQEVFAGIGFPGGLYGEEDLMLGSALISSTYYCS